MSPFAWARAMAAAKAAFVGRRSLTPAAEMAVLYRGVTKALPFLTEGPNAAPARP